MCDNNLINISNDLLHFLWVIRNSVFSEQDLMKKFPSSVKEIEKCIEKYPLPPSHMKVILYIHENSPCSVSQIAKNLNISKPNMTPIIDRLIEYDFVLRYTDPNDRRILRIELTPKALKIFDSIKTALVENICCKLDTLPEEDLTVLHSSINNISSIMKKLTQ